MSQSLFKVGEGLRVMADYFMEEALKSQSLFKVGEGLREYL